MLSFAEELLLLALDDKKGKILDMPAMSLEYGLGGAILMELALKSRIDTDLQHCILLDSSQTGDEILDKVLEMLKKYAATKNAEFWIKKITCEFSNLQEVFLERLIKKRILKKEEHKILWVFSTRRYPVINDKEEREVKTRIREIILNDEKPDPRDVVLISLVNSCNLTAEIFSQKELEFARKRINKISKMDLIARAVSKALIEIQKIIMDTIASESLRPTP